MPRISMRYVRQRFMTEFMRMAPDKREGTIEALMVLHTGLLSADRSQQKGIEVHVKPGVFGAETVEGVSMALKNLVGAGDLPIEQYTMFGSRKDAAPASAEGAGE